MGLLFLRLKMHLVWVCVLSNVLSCQKSPQGTGIGGACSHRVLSGGQENSVDEGEIYKDRDPTEPLLQGGGAGGPVTWV